MTGRRDGSNWRGGRGRGGGRGGSRGGRGVCYSFQRKGHCDRGSSCPYTHESATRNADLRDPTRGSQARRVRESEEQKQARATYNSWKKFLTPNYASDNTYNMKRVWKDALEILQGEDRDWKQQLPRDLDDSTPACNGRAHIKALVQKQAASHNFEEFVEIAHDFLAVITHAALLDDLAVDTYTGGIYNFLSGVNGERAINFFQNVCDALKGINTGGRISLQRDFMERTLISLCTALCELARRDRRARLNEHIEILVDSLHLAKDLVISGDHCVASTIVSKLLAEVRAMIARAKGLLTGEDQRDELASSTLEPPAMMTTYPRNVIVPSNRHDNDKLDIVDIIIFPTQDEIMSDARECLPSTDPDQPHHLADSIERHIDTNFRLLRHDVFGELKKALAGLIHASIEDPNLLHSPHITLGDMRVYSYPNANVSFVNFDQRRGLEAQITFLQPHMVRKFSSSEKSAWWQESRRLDEGSLLSLIWWNGSTVDHLFLAVTQKVTDVKEKYSLVAHETMATITAKPMTLDSKTIERLLHSSATKTRGILLEFPKVIPATFVPILESLQHMQRLSRLPFHQWVVPDIHGNLHEKKVYHDIPPPLYARQVDFQFSLNSLIKSKTDTLQLDPRASVDDDSLVENIVQSTELDRGQCKALIAALTREFAFIQGPPGTGKSYVGLQIVKILLEMKTKARLGPIVIVCYTNHALDQFLEHLLSIGVTKLVRVGGQSKSELLQGRNLRDVARFEGPTKSERWQCAMAYKALKEHEVAANRALGCLRSLPKREDWQQFREYLEGRYHHIYAQFTRTDADGFTVVGRHPFEIWAAKAVENVYTPHAPPEEYQRVIQKANENIYNLNNIERRMLLIHWSNEIRMDHIAELTTTIDDAAETQTKLGKIHDEADRRVLEEADIIGVTTSGLAKRISVLQHVHCKVVLCEEAGEVMEPHMLSALLPTVEHCIQIGDHEQLRPSINNFKELSLESSQGTLHKLDRSQFERLIIGKKQRPVMPVAQLEIQRRMRPDISRLVRETLYPHLTDHLTTMQLPDVVGMRKNVFWLSHGHHEDQKDDIQHTKSKANPWEVHMVHALVRHIVRQGIYKRSDIAVLTPYTGQLQRLRQAMRNDFEVVLSDRDLDALENDGFDTSNASPENANADRQQNHRRKPLEFKKLADCLRIATVDNFQGEEAKIIIVSLVRSNENGKVGFLRTTNRINVLLSRAQHGMYLIGNTETYDSVPMWQKVINMLRASDSVGDHLGLCCPRHTDKIIEVRDPDDFMHYSPEGGCQEACTERLPDCGHRCQARCHSSAMHNVFRCEKPCQRRHQPCDHPCQRATCGEDCGLCMIKVNDVKLPCGHMKNDVQCHKTLDLASIRCVVKVQKTAPGCGHEINVNCSQNINHESFRCPAPCTAVLECGHGCPGSCGQCDRGADGATEHLKCTVVCGRKFGACSHTCNRSCHDGTDCGLCATKCEVRCKHSNCMMRCHEPCAPCVEDCIWSCEHQGLCTMPCSAPCNRLPCDERCTKLLRCGHQCPSVCGEDCPQNYCQACGMHADDIPDVVMGTSYADIDLNESPIVVLGCGHFFTIETLDGTVSLSEVYEVDQKTGAFAGLKENSQLAAAIPQCPTCRCPVRQFVTQRYNRLINQAVIDEMSKRFIVSGQQEMHELEERLEVIQENLSGTRGSVIQRAPALAVNEKAGADTVELLNSTIGSRYSEAVKLINQSKALQHRMAEQHKPAYKLHQAIRDGEHRRNPLHSALEELNLGASSASIHSASDQRVVFGSRLLELKSRSAVIEDKCDILEQLHKKRPTAVDAVQFRGGSPAKLTPAYLHDCSLLIEECMQANLPKIAVETTLYYVRVVQRYSSLKSLDNFVKTPGNSKNDSVTTLRDTAKKFLEVAADLCKQPFKGADALAKAVHDSEKLLRKEWYEAVSKEEIESIKHAMLSGHGGIARHSGHWYKCVNNHPFCIGECGMPMQLAKCPECGAPVGGQSHQAVAGVSRATDMED